MIEISHVGVGCGYKYDLYFDWLEIIFLFNSVQFLA